MTNAVRHYRSLFISDVHLGTFDCQADMLLDFLESTSCDNLYLIGDIVDLWKLRHSIYWPRVKNDIVNAILDKARSGTSVVYIPGNHDELIRDFAGSHYSGVDIRIQAVHVTAKGERLLLLHGDIFDDIVRTMHWLEGVGSNLYELIMIISRFYNRFRKRFGYSYWSFAAFIKYKFKEAVRYIENFEATAAAHAGKLGFDGIVCGHIHHPNDVVLDGIRYLNTGDWVEHCTALTEDDHGELALVNWLDVQKESSAALAAPSDTPRKADVPKAA